MSNSTQLWAVVTMMDSRSEQTIVKRVTTDGGSAVERRESTQLTQRPTQPARRGRDGCPAWMVFVFVMMLAAVAAVLYAPLARAQLIVPLVTSVAVVLTPAFGCHRSR